MARNRIDRPIAALDLRFATFPPMSGRLPELAIRRLWFAVSTTTVILMWNSGQNSICLPARKRAMPRLPPRRPRLCIAGQIALPFRTLFMRQHGADMGETRILHFDWKGERAADFRGPLKYVPVALDRALPCARTSAPL